MNSKTTPDHRPARGLRLTLGALGIVLIAIGVKQVLVQPDPWEVGLWLGGALVLHDALIAPFILAVGLLIVGLARTRGVVRGALAAGGAVVLITLPLLLRPGAPPNPSALPLPYGRNLALVLAAILLITALVVVMNRLRSRRTGS
ncbi:hypothetical protein [Streptomyces sp. NPDC006879]|uniref:hypothetical protein n=1 Tax=Streptomyces sp. NPDC006879 TaxID=3364767 RepID=UPI003675CB02